MTVQTMGAVNSMAVLDATVADVFGDFIASGELTKTADDFAIKTGGKDRKKHMKVVRALLQRAREHKFIFNPKKARFCQEEVEFAGYRVGRGKVKPLLDHVEAVRTMAPPRDKQEVQRFLGMTNYYGWMMPNYGEIAAPLHRLTGKVPFEFGAVELAAFEAIKKELADITEMTIPDLHQPFVIAVDASEAGLGGVLQQWRGGKLCPVAFYRRKLEPAEQRWHIREKEMLAAVEILSKYYHWLEPVPVTVCTDHRSLIEMANASKITGRFRRWVHILQNFRDLRWVYVKGEDNQADWLSRNPGDEVATPEELNAEFRAYFKEAHESAVKGVPMKPTGMSIMEGAKGMPDPEDFPISVFTALQQSDARADDERLAVMASLGETTCHAVAAIPADDMIAMIKAGYGTDPRLSVIIEKLKKGGDESVSSYFLQGDLLFKDDVADGARLCVPEGDALNKLLYAAHDANAHVGILKTVGALRRFYFPDLRAVVRRYIAGCSTCMRSKPEQRKPQGLLQPLPVPQFPWEDISVDVVSVGTESHGCTEILTVVCMLTKGIRAIPLPKKYDSEMIADALVKHVVQYTGPIRRIHSDRGPVFVSDLFHRIWQMQGTDITHTTAFHPQGDGNTEIYNKAIVNALRATLADCADAEWVEVLPFIVWSLNSTVHAGLGVSPFEADYGRPPAQPFDTLNPAPVTGTPLHKRVKVSDKLSAADLRRALDRMTRQALEEAKVRQKRYADEKRRPAHKFRVGDRVVVNREALMSHEDREMMATLGRKLGPLFIGPYKIVETGRNAFRLRLPRSMRAHDMINVKWLKPYRADGSFGRPDEPPPIFLEGEMYFRPQMIKKYESKKLRSGKVLHLYLVKFEGYTDTYNKWVEVEDLELCRDLVKGYWDAKGVDPPRGAVPKEK
jgi:hypothetical protein